MRRILVVEDNREIAGLVALHLKDIQADVEVCHDGAQGLERALAGRHDLIILDLMLPGVDGLEICRRLRNRPVYTPILMLTAKGTELDRVLGLETGADDYLTKPFSMHELVARAKAIMRRAEAMGREPAPAAQTLRAGALEVCGERRVVTVDGREADLTAKEFDLLWHFMKHPGRVFTRGQLLDQVWGYGHDGYEHTVNSHINRLRAKIEENPAQPRYVLTVWGVGYKFSDQPPGPRP